MFPVVIKLPLSLKMLGFYLAYWVEGTCITHCNIPNSLKINVGAFSWLSLCDIISVLLYKRFVEVWWIVIQSCNHLSSIWQLLNHTFPKKFKTTIIVISEYHFELSVSVNLWCGGTRAALLPSKMALPYYRSIGSTISLWITRHHDKPA